MRSTSQFISSVSPFKRKLLFGRNTVEVPTRAGFVYPISPNYELFHYPGLTTSIVPMYLTELAPPRLTGAMGVACPMGVNVGVLVGQVMGLNFLLGKFQTNNR